MNTLERNRTSTQAPWVIVAGGVNRLGGTDKANFALVEYLLAKGLSVHVVTHRIDEALLRHPNVRVDLVSVPGGSWFAGEKLLSFRGYRVAQRITKRHRDARVVVNGGNCFWGDINWVHRVHHAWSPDTVDAPPIHQMKHRLAVAAAKRKELRNLQAARLIITNSELTRRHVIEFIQVEPRIVHTVRLGSESDWTPANDTERAAARAHFRQPLHKPMVTFVGAIGYDNNKGLDTLLKAWRSLCRHSAWDADLVVAGDGRALPRWKGAVERSNFHDRVRFVGFTDRIPELLAATDVLVSPVRYESYGLNVHEALCRGVPAIVSAGAGVAERYPSQMRDLLLPDPEHTEDLVDRMLKWRLSINYWRERAIEFSGELREYSWRDMAERFYRLTTYPDLESDEASPVPAIGGAN